MSSNASGDKDPPGGGLPSDSRNKRVAKAGQWRTPPLPAFPSGYSQRHNPHAPQAAPMQQAHMQPPTLAAPTSIPSNSEDYAKALQEAYRKGAEAAAILAQQQQIPTAMSCPNFSTGQPHAPSAPHTMSVTAEETAYSHQVHPRPTRSSIPDPLSSSMPPPPPQQSLAPATGSHAPSQQHHHPQPQTLQGQPPVANFSNDPTKAGVKQPQSRSLSLPDMSAYAAQAEAEKRQKRLARNRQSARLRRLRKKYLVCMEFARIGRCV